MTDLLSRIRQRPAFNRPSEYAPETEWEFYRHALMDLAEFDRDLALDALEALLACDASSQCIERGGRCWNAERCLAGHEAETILRELRPQHGEGASP